jgi:hypothetical protein
MPPSQTGIGTLGQIGAHAATRSEGLARRQELEALGRAIGMITGYITRGPKASIARSVRVLPSSISTTQMKRADSHRLRQYVQRWVSWLHGGLQGAVTENRFNQIGDYVKNRKSAKPD